MELFYSGLNKLHNSIGNIMILVCLKGLLYNNYNIKELYKRKQEITI